VRRARSPFRKLTSVLVAAGLTAAGVALAAPPASADIAAQIRAEQARLDALNAKAEAAAERYNAGRIALTTAQGQVAVAAGRLAREQRALDALKTTASAVAVQAYKGGSVGSWAVIVSSPQGPATVLDRISSLNRVARSQADVLGKLATARHRQAEAQASASHAAAGARAALDGLQKDRATVLAAAQQAQGLLRDLQAKQAALVQAAKDAASRRAAQARAAALAAQAAAAALAASAFSQGPRVPSFSRPTHYSGNAAQIAVQAAMAQQGDPYVWGAGGPDSFDCSGLTMYAYGQAGISLPHYTGAQWNAGRHVSQSELQPGDLIFFHSDLHHMGMYIGNGQLIHAPHSGDVVRVVSLSGWFQDNYAGAVRVAG
jgi:cell wall-associated NlpC family hydrolase